MVFIQGLFFVRVGLLLYEFYVIICITTLYNILSFVRYYLLSDNKIQYKSRQISDNKFNYLSIIGF